MGALVEMGGKGLAGRFDQEQRRGFTVISGLVMGLGRG
jgi:hypothetical protein